MTRPRCDQPSTSTRTSDEGVYRGGSDGAASPTSSVSRSLVFGMNRLALLQSLLNCTEASGRGRYGFSAVKVHRWLDLPVLLPALRTGRIAAARTSVR